MRKFFRAFLLAVGLSIAAWIVSGFLDNYREWRATVKSDPSAAELYGDACWIDGGMAAGTLALTVLFVFLLKPNRGLRGAAGSEIAAANFKE